jgi:hypothetical protein
MDPHGYALLVYVLLGIIGWIAGMIAGIAIGNYIFRRR